MNGDRTSDERFSQRESLWVQCKQAWQQRATLGNSQLSVEQRRFLPSALEIQETPPSPAGRWLVWTLLALFTIGILWACFGQVDIVVTAPGRIVPSGHVKTIQALETGAVLAIHVRDGDRVEKGQPLISLDPTYADADKQRIHEQIAELSLELSWRRALDTWLAGDSLTVIPPELLENLTAPEKQAAKALYDQHLTQITAQLTSLSRERDATQAELIMARGESQRVAATLPILTDRVAAYKELYDKKFGAKVTYLEMLQQRTELESSVPVLQAREQQLEEELAAFDAQLSATKEEHQTQNLLQLTQLESQRAALVQDGKKANRRQLQQVLVAPVTGTVQQLATHTIGGVVTPAQELMKVVPEDDTIEVEALLQNKDIGFVNQGQVAEVKIDTFNFTKYGLIDAQLVNISNDAVEDEKLGWVFKLRLSLDSDSIPIGEKLVKLSPGMAVTAEIKTGKRRLIEFFLSPLLRYKQESVRER